MLFMEILCASIAGALTIVVFLQVFYRFVLRAPLVWSEELAMFLFQWLVFMGAALAVKHRNHFGLDIIIRNLPSFAKMALDKFAQIIIFLMALGMIFWGHQISEMTMMQTYATLSFPVGYSYAAVVVSGLFMVIFAVINEIEDWQERRKGG